MSMIISIKDSLRQSVEAATGGQVTVMYDDKGYPSHMCRIPMFTLDTIDPSWAAVPHPAFIVNGTTKSEIWVGQYPAVIHDSRALSLPGRDPAASIDFDTADARCSIKGAGWHLMTNAEWAAIALLTHKQFGPDTIRGNTNYGRDYVATFETAPRQDGANPGLASGTARTLTGAGPASWRHNGEPSGIADLVGNVWEWQRGMRLVDGEIQVIADNNAADNTLSTAAGSSAWQAILEDGTLVAPGTANTLKYNSDSGVKLAKVVTATASVNTQYKDVLAAAGTAAPDLTKALGLFPHATDMARGNLYVNNAGERLPLRGGSWHNGALAGSFALNLSYERSLALTLLGFRPAFVL
ncbi:SUMF1/EgtB/PvdO family nonheme iron enzyme [Geoalkalibacter subterraneus]|uniref:Uncharacterized protein n=1 Tax=Geoalkalibacter subterraneus TaxID=483547 RepID=A0A0B5FK27_9BACT|nr:SUMF1/EgtB/PvdO family nonheme iron enzyme [Geoalkalibacter subterraneus]AJF07753.1 hypothetical protein GSUB_15980 [Geoalkalibacter subterraneus]